MQPLIAAILNFIFVAPITEFIIFDFNEITLTAFVVVVSILFVL